MALFTRLKRRIALLRFVSDRFVPRIVQIDHLTRGVALDEHAQCIGEYPALHLGIVLATERIAHRVVQEHGPRGQHLL